MDALVAITALDVAFAGAVAGGIGAFAGVIAAVSPIWIGRQARKHEQDLARDDRIYADVAAAYQALLLFVYKMSATIGAIFPLRAEIGTVPEPMTHDDQLAMTARVSTVASEKVQEAMNSVFEHWEVFVTGMAGLPADLPDPIEATNFLQTLADGFHESVEALRRRIAAEVRGERD